MQVNPVSTATDEAVRREADRMMLRKKLALAQSAGSSRTLSPLLRLYNECYVLAQKIGGGVESETKQAVIGYWQLYLLTSPAGPKSEPITEQPVTMWCISC